MFGVGRPFRSCESDYWSERARPGERVLSPLLTYLAPYYGLPQLVTKAAEVIRRLFLSEIPGPIRAPIISNPATSK
jgi:hypothetical protein